ncbi:putative mitochondrial hypothetical protein [Leptomonas pyrrhocoris]|uniref:Uncharacterized protein n=1 Tax=Leptomonas pyrrhocoris TaxID=157538 RepID=A0A0N1J5C0_LEPPY|nr:putative mitochondrial hypothetical protein [Leptomonas pyrrhocoris]KPA85318.1 putative mitochondrial hypothetical protein [Leptomonas pyrrhocoris]|eukprot:XP_015663757.1 putative mitochondrial hypothetical protein [Leptomonas pyrrhocoris]
MLRRLQAPYAAAGVALVANTARRFPPQHCVVSSSTSFPSSMSCSAMRAPRRAFLDSVFGRHQRKVKLDDIAYDRTTTRYSGTIFGLSADNVMFYAKVAGGAFTMLIVVYIFFKSYIILSRFSLQTVARLGFMGGFLTCLICYTTVISFVRRSRINTTTVYNQSIALVMRNEKVINHLGTHPRTGEFRAYHSTGGFKLPLLRRIRSGSYELSDLLGLKQRRLQMLFTLKNPSSGNEGLVSCDIRRESTGFMSSTNVYKSLSITMYTKNKKAEPETIILIGKPEDVVYQSLIFP